jgi:phage tail sheath protein FI
MTMKTPGVYIVEKNAFPNSIVEVATAVPAFIGYTQRADKQGIALKNKPTRITSLPEYEQYFGTAPTPIFDILPAVSMQTADFMHGNAPQTGYRLEQRAGRYLMYYSMRWFFLNGGGPCFIVSVGDYATPISAVDLKRGIAQLIQEPEPTMLIVPDCVLLGEAGTNASDADCIAVQQAMIQHCGGEMRNRVAILDIWGGYQSNQTNQCTENFRAHIGVNHLDFAAAYYPWLHTTILQDGELDYRHFSDPGKLAQLLRETGDDPTHTAADDPSWLKRNPLYMVIMDAMRKKLNLLPPSAAMAGIYTMVDNTRGVWKAPANVGINGAIEPVVNISHEEQEDLNVTTSGKSINAIRSFIGEGVRVWGARTLDGNSLDWRYINVRRTMIMLEESCRLAVKAMVFEPNVATTWVTIKSMIQNFLTSIWKRGGLVGAVPEDAFSVHVGLGDTMTSEDIVQGILRVTVLVAISRPAEFIEITFQQQMQKA